MTQTQCLIFIGKTVPRLAEAISQIASFGDIILFEDFSLIVRALGNTYLRAARRESATHELSKKNIICLLFHLVEAINAGLPADHLFIASVFAIKHEGEDTSRWSMDGAKRAQFRELHESFTRACVPLSSGIGIRTATGQTITKIKNRCVKQLPKVAPGIP